MIALLLSWLAAMWQLSSIPCGYMSSWLYQFDDVISDDRKYLFRNVEFDTPSNTTDRYGNRWLRIDLETGETEKAPPYFNPHDRDAFGNYVSWCECVDTEGKGSQWEIRFFEPNQLELVSTKVVPMQFPPAIYVLGKYFLCQHDEHYLLYPVTYESVANPKALAISVSSESQLVDLRLLVDNTLIGQVFYPRALGLSGFVGNRHGENWYSRLSSNLSQLQYFDRRTDLPIVLPAAPGKTYELYDRNLSRGLLLVHERSASESIVIQEVDGKILSVIPFAYGSSRFSETGKQVIVPGMYGGMAGFVRRACIYDCESGQLQSRFYESWLHEYAGELFPLLWLAIIVWFVVWIRSSLSLEVSPVWDTAFVNLFALSVVSYQIMVSPGVMDDGGSAYVVLFGLTVGCYVGCCSWLITRKSNALQRMIVVLAIASWMPIAAIFSAEISRGLRLVYFESMITGGCFITYLLLQRFVIRIKTSDSASPFSIKQFLTITLLIALHCAGFRAINGLNLLGTWADFFVIGLTITTMSILLILFCRRAWWIRSPACLLFGTFLAMSGIACLAKIHGIDIRFAFKAVLGEGFAAIGVQGRRLILAIIWTTIFISAWIAIYHPREKRIVRETD